MDIGMILVVQQVLFAILDVTILINIIRQKAKTPTQYIFRELCLAISVMQILSIFACMDTYQLFSELPRACDYTIFIVIMGLMAFCSYCWYEYLCYIIEDKAEINLVRKLIHLSPVIVITMVSLSSPWTHWMFYLDENGIYQRGGAFILQMICPLGYLLASIVLTVVVSRRCQKSKLHEEVKFFLLFIIPAVTGALLQIFIYQGGYTQIGMSIAMIFMYLEMYVEEVKENEKREETEELHLLLKEEKKAEQTKNRIIDSLAKMFFSIYDIDMTDGSFVEIDSKNSEVKSIIGKTGNAQDKMDQMVAHLIEESYAEEMAKFTTISTLNKRLKGKTYISQEFVGVHAGWAEGIFIVAERDVKGDCKHVLWAIKAINEIKEKELILINNSYTDKLTGFFNRRKFEENLAKYPSIPPEENFVFLSLDVNGLKNVNDSLGHKAGDELLIGASDCMKQCLGSYGRLYRIGGDEFAAIIFADEDTLKEIVSDFEDAMSQWSGKYVKEVSVSYGYTTKKEFPDLTVVEMSKIADKRMYEAKAIHYSKKGMDRRGQQMALSALCALYTKILKVNLNTDSYRIISMELEEQNESMGFSDKISEWLSEFGKSGQVHPDDLDDYLEMTNLDYIKDYFDKGNESLTISYRRRYLTESTDTVKYVYGDTLMEIIPADDYSQNNQNIYLYVKRL